MTNFARRTLTAFRNDPFNQVLAIVTGADLTDVPMSFAVRLRAGVAGDPILLLTSGSGIELVDVVDNGDGSFTNVFLLSKAKAAWQAAISDEAYTPTEPGVPVKLAWDLQWTPPAELVGASSAVESTLAVGDLFILESCNA